MSITNILSLAAVVLAVVAVAISYMAFAA